MPSPTLSRPRSGLSPKAMVLLTAATAALGGLLFGYDTAVISGAQLFFKSTFQLSNAQLEMAVGVVLLVTGVCFGVFSLWTGLATGLGTFVTARFFVGGCIGIASMLTPLYIAEMSPARIRGALVSLNQLAITVGIVVAYGVDYALAGQRDWRMMFISAVIPAIVLVVGMIFLPESPRWLAKKGRREEAFENFKRLGRESEAEQEMADVERVLREETGKFRELFSSGFRIAVWIGVGLAVFQQITGINTIIYYAPTILRDAGFSSARVAILGTVGIGTVNVLATILSIFLIDRLGRKPLLIIGCAGQAAMLGYVGYAFSQNQHGLAVFAGVLLYIVFFAISLGPVVWLMLSEIYPTKIRGSAMSLATFANWFANWVVTVSFLSLLDHLGTVHTFWLFAILSLLAILFCIWLVPETKGRSLEEIEESFRRLGHGPAQAS